MYSLMNSLAFSFDAAPASERHRRAPTRAPVNPPGARYLTMWSTRLFLCTKHQKHKEEMVFLFHKHSEAIRQGKSIVAGKKKGSR